MIDGADVEARLFNVIHVTTPSCTVIKLRIDWLLLAQSLTNINSGQKPIS